MPVGKVNVKIQEMKCKYCNKIIGFISSIYRGNYEVQCPSCYFDGWKNQEMKR